MGASLHRNASGKAKHRKLEALPGQRRRNACSFVEAALVVDLRALSGGKHVAAHGSWTYALRIRKSLAYINTWYIWSNMISPHYVELRPVPSKAMQLCNWLWFQHATKVICSEMIFLASGALKLKPHLPPFLAQLLSRTMR